MTRLTTDKPNGMYELAHNSCYIGDDGASRYRDFETDIDARELARDLMQNYYLWDENDNAMHDDDVFDDEMLDNLMYGSKEIQGLIALFYRNLWAMADLRERLKAYEDAEENGLLLKLPCKIGDDVYKIPSKVNYDLNILSKHPENNRIYHQKVARIVIEAGHWYVECDKDREYGTGRLCIDYFFKETWFLSKEEAEAALAKMKSEV